MTKEKKLSPYSIVREVMSTLTPGQCINIDEIIKRSGVDTRTAYIAIHQLMHEEAVKTSLFKDENGELSLVYSWNNFDKETT